MPYYACDIETTGLSEFTDKVLCIGVYSIEKGYQYFKTIEEFRGFLGAGTELIFHNAKFDINFLRRHGLDLRPHFVYDTRSIATIVIPTPEIAASQSHAYSLENLYIQLLRGQRYKLNRADMTSYTEEEVKAYNEKDCRVTYDLFMHLLKTLPLKDWEFVDSWLMPTTKLLVDMEYNGVGVDTDRLISYQQVVEREKFEALAELLELTKEARGKWNEIKIKELAELMELRYQAALRKYPKNPEGWRIRYQVIFENAKKKITDFNFKSQLQVKWLLKEFCGLSLLNRRTQKETTDEAMLRRHEGSNPICRALLGYREKEKLLSTCIPALLHHLSPDARVRPFFNIGGTRTGRLSSSSPNFQQVPRGYLRSCIVPQKGFKFFIADYAQIEVRIIAELAQEEKLLEAFHEGVDPYSLIAINLFKLDAPAHEIKSQFPAHRAVAKTVGLSILYGTGPNKLREVLEKELEISLSYNEARDFIINYRSSFPRITAYKTAIESKLSNRKKVYNLLGRPVYIHYNENLYMTALNTVVQGSASDLVLKAYARIYQSIPFIRPVLTVHDEIVFEIPEGKINEYILQQIETMMTTAMEKDLGLTVPLKIEYTLADEWAKPA